MDCANIGLAESLPDAPGIRNQGNVEPSHREASAISEPSDRLR